MLTEEGGERGKVGHGDEEEHGGHQTLQLKMKSFFLSFFRRCQRHSSILYGGNVQCSQRVENNNKDVSSLTEDSRATKD